MPLYRLPGTDYEVCVARPPKSKVEQPTLEEHAALDAYFADPAHRDPDTGAAYQLHGREIPGVHGDVVTYPLSESE